MPQTVKVPAYVSRNAERGLKLHEEGRTGEGIQPATIREARDMVEGAISPDKVRRMGPWFRRHKADLDAPKNSNPNDPGYPGAGLAAWLLWGGDSNGSMRAAEWAERTAARLDREEQKDALLTTAGNQMASLDEQLSAALAQVESLQAAAAAVSEESKVALAAAEAKAAADVAAALAERDTLAAQVADLAAKVAALESEKASAEAQAAKIVAAAAATPADVSGVVESAPKAKSREDLLAEFRAIKDPAEKAAFYNANAKALTSF